MPIHENLKPDLTSEAKLVKSMQDILNIPVVKKAVIEGRIVDRPSGWSKRSNAPYYRERFALELKAALDQMIEDKEDREYKFEDFNMTRNSLYLRVKQSQMYLVDRLDPEGKYRALCEQIAVTKEKTGVRLSFNKDVRIRRDSSHESIDFFPTKVVSKDEQESILSEIHNWIGEAKEGDFVEFTDLSLTPEEVNELQTLLAFIDTIASEVSSSRVKLVKIPQI